MSNYHLIYSIPSTCRKNNSSFEGDKMGVDIFLKSTQKDCVGCLNLCIINSHKACGYRKSSLNLYANRKICIKIKSSIH